METKIMTTTHSRKIDVGDPKVRKLVMAADHWLGPLPPGKSYTHARAKRLGELSDASGLSLNGIKGILQGRESTIMETSYRCLKHAMDELEPEWEETNYDKLEEEEANLRPMIPMDELYQDQVGNGSAVAVVTLEDIRKVIREELQALYAQQIADIQGVGRWLQSSHEEYRP